MRHKKINSYNINQFYTSGYKDIKELLKNFDDALKDFGLELVQGDNADGRLSLGESYWFKIEKRRK